MRNTAILAAAFIGCGAILPLPTATPAIAQGKLPCADQVQVCMGRCSSSFGQAKNQCEETCAYNGERCKKGLPPTNPFPQSQSDTPRARKAMEATRFLPCKFGPRGPFQDKSGYCRYQ